MSTLAIASFGAVYGALWAAHQVGDHWVQSHHQSQAKAETGWSGRLHCVAHVATYTATALVSLLVLVLAFGLPLSGPFTAAGLAFSAVTHYFADRRAPLLWLARKTGHGGFAEVKSGGINGPYLLDQSFHAGCLFVAAVLIAAGI